VQKRKLLTLCLAVAVCVPTIILTCRNIGINISKSVPFRVYSIDKTDKHFSCESYVLFYLTKDPLNILPDKVKLVKRIACAPGMSLNSSKEEFICDGKLIAIRRDKANMKFSFNGTVPKGMYFMSGDHFRSYDSRIWGFLNEKDIIAVVHPIF